MFIEVPEKVAQKTVVKRDGKKVEFDGAKIALAIQKGFGDVIEIAPATTKYDETDVNKVYSKVLSRIEKLEGERIKIEEIQDLIEEELKNNGYQDVFEAFSSYREKRAQSRQLFFDEKKQHKFLKALENIGLKTIHDGDSKANNEDKSTSRSTMFQYGSTISRQFAKTYLLKKKFSEAHENGDIYIHDLNFLPMGTTTCCQINLNKLYEDGFTVGYGFVREPNDIMSYAILAAIAIQSNQNDQHGEQGIPAFDYYMAPGVLKTFKKSFKQIVFDYLELTDFDKFIAINGIEREIEKINTIQFDISIFDKYCRESEELKRMFRICYKKAMQKTDRATYQAMEAFIHNLNTIYSKAGEEVPYSSINFGTDISPEGRMVIKNLLKAIEAGLGNHETALFPISIFKLKEGINYNENDPNYDLFELACNISVKRMLPRFSFLDVPFNKIYQNDNYDTEVAYMGNTIRVIENVVDTNKIVTSGRGNLSYTTINLPRIGIKHGNPANEKLGQKEFFEELEEKMDLVKDQLIERFEIQCKKNITNFPFLLGQFVWIDSEKLKDADNLRKVLKHGTLSIGFTGLAECLKALTGKNQAESEEVQKLGLKIVKFMRQKCDEYSKKYNLNITLLATESEKLSSKFVKLDKAIYGKRKGITDKEHYTNSFFVPENTKISLENNIIYIPLNSLKENNVQELMKVLKIMKNEGIGYVAISS